MYQHRHIEGEALLCRLPMHRQTMLWGNKAEGDNFNSSALLNMHSSAPYHSKIRHASSPEAVPAYVALHCL